jgi:hypothetical protein
MAGLWTGERVTVLFVGALLVAASYLFLSPNAALFFLLVYAILAPLLVTGARRVNTGGR